MGFGDVVKRGWQFLSGAVKRGKQLHQFVSNNAHHFQTAVNLASKAHQYVGHALNAADNFLGSQPPVVQKRSAVAPLDPAQSWNPTGGGGGG